MAPRYFQANRGFWWKELGTLPPNVWDPAAEPQAAADCAHLIHTFSPSGGAPTSQFLYVPVYISLFVQNVC